MVNDRKRDAGFTLTELMVVVVILSLLATLSTPLFSRDNSARKGRDWTKMVAQLLQRARFQAMSDRANIHVVLYRTHVDMYREDPPGNCCALLTSISGPVADADKTVAIWEARTDSTQPSAQSSTLTAAAAIPTSPAANDIIFTSVGSAVTFDDRTTPANWRVYLRNELLPSINPDASFVINVGGLTGFVSSNDKVTLP